MASTKIEFQGLICSFLALSVGTAGDLRRRKLFKAWVFYFKSLNARLLVPEVRVRHVINATTDIKTPPMLRAAKQRARRARKWEGSLDGESSRPASLSVLGRLGPEGLMRDRSIQQRK